MPKTAESERLLPKWVGVFFIAGAVILIPWIIVLMTSTPQEFGLVKHWKVVWVGFDCFLVTGFALTAYRVATRSPRGAITAACTGTMLLVDAWFDILTSRRPTEQLLAVLMALFAEVPCALICFFVSRRIVSMFEQAAPHLREAGFRIVRGRLVAPVKAAAEAAHEVKEAVQEKAGEVVEGAQAAVQHVAAAAVPEPAGPAALASVPQCAPAPVESAPVADQVQREEHGAAA